jgi:hypothetical protein
MRSGGREGALMLDTSIEAQASAIREDTLALAKLIFDVYKNPEDNGIIVEDKITNDERYSN